MAAIPPVEITLRVDFGDGDEDAIYLRTKHSVLAALRAAGGAPPAGGAAPAECTVQVEATPELRDLVERAEAVAATLDARAAAPIELEAAGDLPTEATKLARLTVAAERLCEELRRAGDNLPAHCTTSLCDTCGRRLAVYATGGDDWTEESPRLACATCAEGHGPGDELPIGAALKMVEAELAAQKAGG